VNNLRMQTLIKMVFLDKDVSRVIWRSSYLIQSYMHLKQN